MIKNLIVLISLLLILSCSIPINSEWYELDQVPAELQNKRKAVSIYSWVVNNVDYRLYANGFHYAQQTLDDRIGNCANMTLLMLALNYKIRNNKGELVYCKNKGGLHYTIRIDGIIIEPDILEIYEIVSFDDIANYIYFRQ